tara:strand:- start:599 stop:784 length:186 start_codon:yes stop_codon:yes gene_type:complete
MSELKSENAATSAKVNGVKIEVAVQVPLTNQSHENSVRAMVFFLDRSTNSVERFRPSGVLV